MLFESGFWLIRAGLTEKGKQKNKIYDNEESNVSVWNTPRGNQNVPFGEGVPEAPYRV